MKLKKIYDEGQRIEFDALLKTDFHCVNCGKKSVYIVDDGGDYCHPRGLKPSPLGEDFSKNLLLNNQSLMK